MRKAPKHYSAEKELAILKRHLVDRVPVSDLCEEPALQPTAFYPWQKEFLENGAAAFQALRGPHRELDEKQKRIHSWKRRCRPRMKSWPRSWRSISH
jgi:hypothetical protein